MVSRDNAYSRLVGTVKVILPILALGVLSTLFILSQPSRQGEPLQFLDVGLEDIAEEEHLSQPDYRSVTASGGALRLTAADLRPLPDADGQYVGTALKGWITNVDGVAYVLSSDEGSLDETAGLAHLTGNVTLTRHDGHTALSDEVEITTDLTKLVSAGPVHGFGPLGTLDANSMEILGQPDLGSGTLTVFRGDVRLLYDPKTNAPEIE